MKVFKFGGASVNSAAAVRNMSDIVRRHSDGQLLVVVSAMGKTTNLLERMVPEVCDRASLPQLLNQLITYHLQIADELFDDKGDEVYAAIQQLFDQLRQRCEAAPTSYNYDYDQIVCYGELISTTIISHYLNHIGIENQWVDVRKLITTDCHYREGNVDWQRTAEQCRTRLDGSCTIHVTQGFIAGTADGNTTTLGREGSDYSAAILSYCLDAGQMVIWKDVQGFLNADPKYFKDTVKIDQIPYNEAIELAYYGASVIHPKTVKPLQNKGIALHIRSFLAPQGSGSVVGPFRSIAPLTPLYIFKNQQILISIQPKDFSFIAENNLQTIFKALADLNIKVNMMQNSALSFSICIDYNEILVKQLTERLQRQFAIRYNRDLQLITIRYYTDDIIDTVVAERKILLQQRSRLICQLIVEL